MRLGLIVAAGLGLACVCESVPAQATFAPVTAPISATVPAVQQAAYWWHGHRYWHRHWVGRRFYGGVWVGPHWRYY